MELIVKGSPGTAQTWFGWGDVRVPDRLLSDAGGRWHHSFAESHRQRDGGEQESDQHRGVYAVTRQHEAAGEGPTGDAYVDGGGDRGGGKVGAPRRDPQYEAA